ncbi:rod shape-determining protein MreC [Catenovulum sp. SM1970]|uniref:rod shape-determining protein MreC n=1 Tax=Marinifaba aquimaris TaxID=2741323 RepID=UPI0015745491|nr:rod shape-determining protein MreC [Marinifaba aquimaris]NTS75873.1 rod shape-determining protein MreC [Marinifaba aquimaris]
MTPLFGRGPSLQARLIIATVLSVVLIFVDHKMDGFQKVRVVLNSMVSPLQYAANLPKALLDWSAESLAFRQSLINDNQALKQDVLLLNEKLQRMDFVERENQRLRALLKSPVRGEADKMVAEVMSVETNPNSHQVLINRGLLHGVFEGQPVLDASGIVGQVVNVGSTTSRVLLISDITHAIPLRIARNSVRVTAAGSGLLDRMDLQHVPHSTDIVEGDELVSSGLAGVFPEGYPVAKVTRITRNKSLPFSQIRVEPIAKLDRIRYLLLLWPPHLEHKPKFDVLEELIDKASDVAGESND